MDEPVLSVPIHTSHWEEGEPEAGPLLEAPMDAATKERLRSCTGYPPKEAGLDVFNDYVRGPLREALVDKLGADTFLTWRMCFAAFMPYIFYCLAMSLEELLLVEVSNLTLGIQMWALCLAQWLILVCGILPLFPLYLEVARAVDSALDPGILQKLLMSLMGSVSLS